ncbi:MAG: hypothetical protein IJK18_02845 [Clostridia bacterium]|nr:hypothetical protein [Clostridia bacterium]
MADNLNISPDMINNLINMLKNDPNNQSAQNTQQENQTNTNQRNQYETNINNQSNTSSKSASSSVNIDFETIMKMKSIMETLNNSNNQDSNLLYSLKPYLRKSRQAKLDQYINILKITQVSKFFNTKNEKKSDNNNIV